MNFSYNARYIPAIPVIEIALSLPGEGQQFGPLQGIIDTGADGSLVPISHLAKINATYVDEALLRSQWGEWRSASVYMLDIHVGEYSLPGIYVVGDDLGDEIILGRNFLNHLRLLLDGPDAVTQLLETEMKSRSVRHKK
jgi:predicted aspartyl protease